MFITFIEKILNEKISLKEILKIVLPLLFTGTLVYSTHLINSQLILLEQTVSKLSDKVVELDQENVLLKRYLLEKNEKLKEIEDTLKYQLNSDVINSDVLIATNDMTPFFIKTAGVIIAGVVILSVVSHISGFSFSIKAFMPASVYHIVQDYTPFLQTEKVFTYKDLLSKTDWLIKIFNEKHVSLLVKTENGPDFIKVSDYLNGLNYNNALIPIDNSIIAFDILAAPSVPMLETTAEIANRIMSVI